MALAGGAVTLAVCGRGAGAEDRGPEDPGRAAGMTPGGIFPTAGLACGVGADSGCPGTGVGARRPGGTTAGPGVTRGTWQS